MIDRKLLEAVTDRASLTALLSTPENRGGLGWPVDADAPFTVEPEISAGIKGDGQVTVRRLVPASTNEPFLILLAEFERPYLRRDLRELLTSLRRHARESGRFADKDGTSDTIFIVAAPGYEDVRFVLFEEREKGLPKIRSFGWERGQIGRTLFEFNLARLCQSRPADWRRAWDVDALTKEFFTEISNLFYDTSDAIGNAIPDENQRRLYVQTLFNRLIFLRFVEKKGWLSFGGEKSEYLRALWQASQDSPAPFWPTRLNRLFNALNHETGDTSHVDAKDLIGEVPYLNGGLFDENLFAAENVVARVPARIFEALLGPDGVFYRYNFTVEESSPLDVQVAVDPEILGKIFEQLTVSSKRHDTGSYYTPREIVQFMCREALVGYLGGRGIVEVKARTLVYDHNDDELSNQEGTLAWEALRAIKVVDPACGSGAYLLGMLQELFALFEKLRRDDRKFSDDPAKEAHDRKLWIIENNIYGVDLQAFATNTAMLRLWLTLLVEDESPEPQPLPNLEYKIEVGDALMGPNPSHPIDWSNLRKSVGTTLDLWDREATLKQLLTLRAEYQNAHGPHKARLKAELETTLAELREKVTGNRSKAPATFNWQLEFFDVFLDPKRPAGFDVVLANPPYVRQEGIKQAMGDAYKKALVRSFKAGSGTADLYVFFYERAVDLLSRGGMLAFISSNKWFRAAYGKDLRRLIAQSTNIRSIIDFGELPVFSAATFPMIFVAQKGEAEQQAPTFTQVKSLAPPYPDVNALVDSSGLTLPPDAIRNDEWALVEQTILDRLRKMESSGTPLREYVQGKMFRGVLTGLSAAFVVDGSTRDELVAEDVKSAEILKPLVVGDDVRKWVLRRRTSSARSTRKPKGLRTLGDKFLVFTRRGIDINQYPAVKKHLEKWRTQLEPRPRDWDIEQDGEWAGRKPGTYQWFEVQDEIAYYAEFEKPKILYPDIAKESRFALDTTGIYCLNSIYMIPSDDRYLLGVLNSDAAWEWFRQSCWSTSFEESGRLQFFTDVVAKFPIPGATSTDKDAIADLVQHCVDHKSTDPSAEVTELEAEIDARVEFLYFHRGERGTRPNDAGEDVPYPDTYDEYLALQQAETGTIVEDVRKLIAQGESAKVEFKETLEAGGTTPEHKAAVFTASLRAICSFINKEGGTLLIGVHDTNGVIGLERDGATDPAGRDRFLQRIAGGLKNRALNYAPNLVDVEFAEIDGKWIAVVRVKATKGAKVLLDGKLYIRDLTTTVELDPTTMAYLANAETDEP